MIVRELAWIQLLGRGTLIHVNGEEITDQLEEQECPEL